MVIEAIYQNQISVTENKNIDPPRDRQNSSNKKQTTRSPQGIDKIVPKKLSSEFYHLAEQAVKEELNSEVESQSKETFWIKMGEQLEIDGVPVDEISMLMQKTIEEKLYEKKFKSLGITREQYKWHSGHFFRITREHSWINPHYSHPTNQDPEKKPKPISSYQSENQSWVDVIDDMLEFLRAEKSFLLKNHFNSKIPQNESRESILLMSKAITHANERFNNKLKIAPSHYSILFRNFLHSMSSHLSVPYYEHVRKKETFTAKQAGKIIRGTIKDLPFQFEPITPDEAEADGFSGESCPECGNFRTEITMRVQQYKEDGISKSRGIRQIHCFKEDKDYDAPKARMPAENISESEW